MNLGEIEKTLETMKVSLNGELVVIDLKFMYLPLNQEINYRLYLSNEGNGTLSCSEMFSVEENYKMEFSFDLVKEA